MSILNPAGIEQIAGVVGGTLISILPSNVQNNFDNGSEVLKIQATLEEVHHSTLEVTEHPVQTGAAITDHSYNRPAEIVLKCAWSNSSLSGLLAGATDRQTINLKKMLSGAISDQTYVSGIYTQLLALKEARMPISISTSLKLYQNMLITAIQVTRDVKTYQALMCSITCKEVILVDFLSGEVASADQLLAQTTANITALGSQNLLGNGVNVPPQLPSLSWMSEP